METFAIGTDGAIGTQRALGTSGLPLARFLDWAKPSLAEAATLAARVLEAAAALPGETDVVAAAALVADIAGSAGRPNRPLTTREERLAVRLATAANPSSLSRRGPRKAARGLDMAVGPAAAREAAERGLAALARAVASHDAPLAILWEPVATRSPGAPAGRRIPPPAKRPPIWPRVWKGVAVAAVVALLLGIELRLYGDRVSHNVGVLLSGNVSKTAEAAGPRRPGPIPVLGPALAGPVTHLELRALDGCRGGSTCNAVLQVTATPQNQPLAVAFNLVVVDRCQAAQNPGPGGVLTVPPGQDRAAVPVTLSLPAGKALAVIPLANSPVTVAGTPLRTPGDDAC